MNDFDKIVLNFFKNYQDRGMKKWTGFFLSDHTMKIYRDQQRRNAKQRRKKPQSQEKISLRLLTAYSQHQLVRVQTNVIDENGQLPSDIIGFVAGYYDDQIIVANQKIKLADIDYVEIAAKN